VTASNLQTVSALNSRIMLSFKPCSIYARARYQATLLVPSPFRLRTQRGLYRQHKLSRSRLATREQAASSWPLNYAAAWFYECNGLQSMHAHVLPVAV
jgi:hypothetical protein